MTAWIEFEYCVWISLFPLDFRILSHLFHDTYLDASEGKQQFACVDDEIL